MSEEFQATLERVAGEHGVGPLALERQNNVGADDTPFEAALRQNVSRVLRQEKAAARPDPAEAEERAAIRAEREHREAEVKAGRALTRAVDVGVKPEIRDTQELAWRRAQRREAEKEAVAMPVQPGQSLDERIKAAQAWHPLPEPTKRLLKGASDTVAKEREAAASFGLSLEESLAAQTAKRIETNDAVSPLLQRIAEAEPGKDPAQVAQWYADVAESFRKDPQGTFKALGEHIGVIKPLTPEQHREHQARAEQARQSALVHGVTSVIDSFARSVPDFQQHEGMMEQAIANGWIARTGHVMTDLTNAYHFARSRSGYRAA